ncbi:MAG: HAMP domain-containing sensor histidine kinase [Ethanoligenens sp.]|uniref:HAMP domain-containing sensor histidine kinase n=1 Tax=Ethanoligenens sp. TaxID=2099655 RepID=UPI0039E762C4
MKLKPIFLFMVVFFLVGLSVLFCILRTDSADIPDPVACNDVARTLGEQWNALDATHLPDKQYPFDYAVLDLNGTVRAATRAGLPEASIPAAVRRRDTILDIEADGKVVGNVLFYNQAMHDQQTEQQTLWFAGIFLLAAPLLFCAGFALYLHGLLVRPFRRLEAFARRVAAGNLDIPLAMDKRNLFGPFTESFDLMRAELAHARENEYKVSQSKKELVASLSHDVKTPVASIQAITELMLVREQDADKCKSWQTVYTKVEQINQLINDLFHASLEELQKLSVSPTEESSAVLGSLLHAADYNGHAVIMPIPSCILRFDRLRLQQVFDNIMHNSYKYANTAIQVTFAFDGAFLTVTIADEGAGAPPESLSLLCNKFYRGANATEKSGSGLGLYLAQYLMVQMGGSLTCENRMNGNAVCGFSVHLCIPLAQ